MNATRFPYTITLATAAAAAVAQRAAQFAGIDSLAAPRQDAAVTAVAPVAQLPLVVVVGAREASLDERTAQRPPTVVVTGHAVRTVAKSAVQAPAI